MTSRAHVYKVLTLSSGAALTGATVNIYTPGTTTPIADTLYTTATGGGTLSQGFVSASGLVEFWLAAPQRVDIGYTPSGGGESIVTVDAQYAPADLATLSAVALREFLLTPTAVKTSNYTAAVGDFVRADTTSAFTVTLPTTPADGTVIGARIDVLGAGNSLTIAAGGSDVFIKTGGATSVTLKLADESMIFKYRAAESVWTVTEHGYSRTSLMTEVVNTIGNMGASQTLPGLPFTRHRGTLNNASCTVTMPTAVAGMSFSLETTQDGTGGRDFTATGVRWAGGSKPAASTAAGAIDKWGFVCDDGTHWDGGLIGKAYA